MKKEKVIIIGAGPAGLTAGYELLKKSKNYEVIILEESQEIGGISKTIKHNGNRMDIGGHRFFSKDQDVMNFWKEIMPIQGQPSYDDKKLNRQKTMAPEGPDPEKEDKVMLLRNRVSRIYYLKKFFDYPISMKKDTFKNMGLKRTIQSGLSYLKSIFLKKPETSLENFYINRFGKKLYSMFFEGYTEKLWGRHPKEISADWGAQRVKGLSIISVLKDMFSKVFHFKSKTVETSLIEEFMYPKYGPGQLWETVANEIEKMGGQIKKGFKVEKINCLEHKIKSVICNVNGNKEIINGDIFISSMPLKELVKGLSQEPPENIKKIAEGLPYRDFITVGLLVKKLNLKNETQIKTLGNIVPDCWIYVQEPEVKLGRIQIFNNWSPYMVKNPDDTVWIGLEYFCNENDQFWNMSDKEFIDFATQELISIGIIKENDVLDCHREKVKKAYPAYFDTYSQIDDLIKYLNEFDNLYCVGRNGQHRYNNMDHSMVTSFETVKNILNNNKDKTNIWKVNTEKEYHEETKSRSQVVTSPKKPRRIKIPYLKKNSYLICFIILLFVNYLIVTSCIDNDYWWIVNRGKYILNNGIPHIEPFSIHSNLNFITQQWLTSVIFYFFEKNWGIKSIPILIIIMSVIITIFIYKICMLISSKNFKLSVILTTSSSFFLTMYFFRARPQIFTYALILALVLILESYIKNGNKKQLILLPLISVLQINLHASMWFMLFCFTVPYLLDGYNFKYLNKDIYKKKPIIIATIAMLFAGLLNPYGINAITYIFRSYGVEAINNHITEMATLNVHDLLGKITFCYLVIIFLTYIIKGKDQVKIRYLLLLLGTSYLSLSAIKGISYLIIAAILSLSYLLKDTLKIKPEKEQYSAHHKIYYLIIILSVLIIIGIDYSKRELSYIPELKDGLNKVLAQYNQEDIVMYTNYSNGGYVEYRGIKVYIDACAETFLKSNNNQEDILLEYFDLIDKNLNYEEFIAKYNFTHILVDETEALYKYMETENNYELFYKGKLYQKKTYKIYVRKDLISQQG